MFSATSRSLEQPKPTTTNGHNPSPAAFRSSTSTTTDAASSLPSTGTSVIGRDLTLLGEKITIVSQNKLRVDGDVRDRKSVV